MGLFAAFISKTFLPLIKSQNPCAIRSFLFICRAKGPRAKWKVNESGSNIASIVRKRLYKCILRSSFYVTDVPRMPIHPSSIFTFLFTYKRTKSNESESKSGGRQEQEIVKERENMKRRKGRKWIMWAIRVHRDRVSSFISIITCVFDCKPWKILCIALFHCFPL